jgi:competence protein ComEA
MQLLPVPWSSREKKLAIALSVVVVIGFFYFFWDREDKRDAIPLPPYEAALNTKQAKETPSTPSTLVIDVKGAVLKPGIHKLPADARVYDAIEQAGGPQQAADLNQVNLAQRLTDGMVVYIPRKGESEKQAPFSGMSSATDGKVHVNTASAEELETLNGIGKAKAEAILKYREEHGKFQSVEDLKEVPGIGESTIDRFREQVVVP